MLATSGRTGHEHDVGVDGRAGGRQPRDRGAAGGSAPPPRVSRHRPAPAGAHRRGDGDRQGAPGPAPSPGRPPCGRAVHRGELRRDSRDAARVRDVRLRARRVHGRAPAEVGAPRGGAAGHVLPRRGRAPARGGPGEAPQGHRGPRGPASRRDAEHRPRRLDHRRHQRGPRDGAPGRPVPGGALPPTVGLDLSAAGSADPRGRRRSARRAVPGACVRGVWPRRQAARHRCAPGAPRVSVARQRARARERHGAGRLARRGGDRGGRAARDRAACRPQVPRRRVAGRRRHRRPRRETGRTSSSSSQPSIRRAGMFPWPRAVWGSPGTRFATGWRSTGCAPASPRRARPGLRPIGQRRRRWRRVRRARRSSTRSDARRRRRLPRRRSRAGSRPCAGSSGG